MSYKINLEKGAKLDIDDALFYYKNNVSKSVAKNFSTDVRERFKAIKINPYYRQYANGYRGLPLKTFPYIIFFKIDEENKIVYINSVFETHQHPCKNAIIR